jgi:flagellar biosynthesis protein FliQ
MFKRFIVAVTALLAIAAIAGLIVYIVDARLPINRQTATIRPADPLTTPTQRRRLVS